METYRGEIIWKYRKKRGRNFWFGGLWKLSPLPWIRSSSTTIVSATATFSVGRWRTSTIFFVVRPRRVALINAGCWLVWTQCYWVVDTYTTIIDFHSRTVVSSNSSIFGPIKIHKTKATRATSLQKRNDKPNIIDVKWKCFFFPL